MNENIVYHYRSTTTALSILTNKEFWMTNSRNMNDENESIGVYKLFFDLLKTHDEAKVLDKMFKLVESPGYIQMYENPVGAYPEYIVCFTKDPDSVSQWISYADDGNGISIGFDEKGLINIASSVYDLKYTNIEYADKEKICNYISGIYNDLINHLDEVETDIVGEAMKLIKRYYPLGSACKTSHYASENETRLIYNYNGEQNILPDGWELNGPIAYAKRNMINTRFSLKFSKDIIKKLVLGPKYQKRYFEIESALYDLEYKNVVIDQSTSGYK